MSNKQITVTLDGVSMQLQKPDIDGDGVTGGVERIKQRFTDENTTNIIQPTELGESLKELNSDHIEPNTRMSGIDMRSRLHYIEANSILALDALVALGILPTRTLAFSRQKKRLSVSVSGKGREEIVQIVAGKREQDKAVSNGFMDKIKGWAGGK